MTCTKNSYARKGPLATLWMATAITLGVLCLPVLTQANSGATTALNGLVECAKIRSHLNRLECFDKLALEVATAEAIPGPTKQSIANEPPVMKPPEKKLPEAKPAVVETAVNATSTEPQAFGRSSLPPKFTKEPNLVAKISQLTQLDRGNFQITLDNDQVWQEIEYDKRTRYKLGDQVVIKRGFLGTYNLASERTGVRNKVRRLR